MTVLVKAVTEALCMLAIQSLCVVRLGYDLFACFCRLLLFLSLCADLCPGCPGREQFRRVPESSLLLGWIGSAK